MALAEAEGGGAGGREGDGGRTNKWVRREMKKKTRMKKIKSENKTMVEADE